MRKFLAKSPPFLPFDLVQPTAPPSPLPLAPAYSSPYGNEAVTSQGNTRALIGQWVNSKLQAPPPPV